MGDGDPTEEKWYKKKAKELIFFGCVGGFSVLNGFAYAISVSKREDPKAFSEKLSTNPQVFADGADLAARAFRWGSLWAVTGVSLVCLGIWAVSGARNMDEFRTKAGTILPKIPKKPIEQQDRNDFESVREFFQYYIDKDEEAQRKKEQKTSLFKDMLGNENHLGTDKK